MLKNLIAKFAKILLQPVPCLGYQTRIYPTIGEMFVVHDSLDFGSLATDEQMSRIAAFWAQAETFDIPLASESVTPTGLGQNSTFDINPANGIPMMCDTLDVMGNPFGWSDSDTEVDI